MNKKLLLAVAICAVTTLSAHSQTATTLSILNPTTAGSSITITPGQSFSAEVFVANLSAPLDAFDLTLVLPAGITVSSYTDTVPNGWFPLSADPSGPYGAEDAFGTDITPGGELVLANLQVASNFVLTANNNTISFSAPGVFQDLTDAGGVAIPYTAKSLTLQVAAVPEPSTWVSLAMGGLFLFGLRRFRVRNS